MWLEGEAMCPHCECLCRIMTHRRMGILVAKGGDFGDCPYIDHCETCRFGRYGLGRCIRVFHRALDRVGLRCSLSDHFWMEGYFGSKKGKRLGGGV